LGRFFFFLSLLTRGVSSGVVEIGRPETGDEILSSEGSEPEISSFFALCFSLSRLCFLAALSASLRNLFSRFRSSLFASTLSASSPDASMSPGRDRIGEVAVGSVLTISFWMSSGPRMGPRKNLEYRQRRAVSRLARERREGRGAEGPGVASIHKEGVDAPEETGVPTMGGRLDSIPVDVCLNSKAGRVRFVPGCGRSSSSSSSLEKTFYLDCRRGHRKQVVPEREGFIPVFSDASEISFLRGCDGT